MSKSEVTPSFHHLKIKIHSDKHRTEGKIKVIPFLELNQKEKYLISKSMRYN